MSASHKTNRFEPQLPAEQGQHYSLIKQAIPHCLINASPQRRTALKQTKPRVPAWYAHSTAVQKAHIKPLLEAMCASQNTLDKTLSGIQTAEDFGRSLLEAGLKNIGFSLPVHDVSLRLYVLQGNFVIGTSGHKVQTFTVLQAALHNFEEPEAQSDYFSSPSGFITTPDSLGRYEPYETDLTVERFAALCRTLDIGGQYQRYLETFFRPTGVVTKQSLRRQYITHQKDALRADAFLAQLKSDIAQSHLELVERIINDEQAIMLNDDLQVWYRIPSVMNISLHGCLVIDLSVKYHYTSGIIVWIPGDPEHPLKYYATFDAFSDELTRKLSAPSSTEVNGLTPYQHFLTRFIERKHLPYYYRRLSRVATSEPAQPSGTEWLRAEQGKFLLHVREPASSLKHESPIPTQPPRMISEKLSFHVNAHSIHGLWAQVEVWGALFEIMRSRVFSDAEISAVPTAEADASYRAKRLSHYLTIGMLGLNLVSIMVPGLGEVMLVVMAGQLMYEVLDGFVEWSEGDTDAAWGHLTDIVENLAMLAAGGAVVQVGVVPVIEKLKAVMLPNGATRLWKPDLKPYAQSTTRVNDSWVNEAGGHTRNSQQTLWHEGAQYLLEKDPVFDDYRVQHPTRPDVYQPMFKHNGDGVWVHEGEQPLTWEGETLRRRLGPSVEGLSDSELKQILSISDVSEDQLRRLYVENEPTPMLLRDVIRQFQNYAKARSVVAQVRAGAMSRDVCGYAAHFAVELPRWPSNKSISIVGDERAWLPPKNQGSGRAGEVIRITDVELMSGKLPERVVDALSSNELDDLLGVNIPVQREARIEVFKQRLAMHMENNHLRLFESLNADAVVESDPGFKSIELFARVYKRLPTACVRALLANASPSETALLAEGKIPLRLGRIAHRLQRDVRLSQAYRGLYLQDLVNTDTETLALNTVQNLPGWANDLRLEIREGSFRGPLRASFGPPKAAHRKVLVRTGDAAYEAYDNAENALHGSDDLYRSLQHALPDAHRASLGLPYTWQGDELQLKIQKHALSRDQLRALLKMQPENPYFFNAPKQLATGRLGYLLSGRGGSGAFRLRALSTRYQVLYPTEARVSAGVGMSELYMDFTSFMRLHGVETEQRLVELEHEYWALETTLIEWAASPINGAPVTSALTDAQRAILRDRKIIKSMLTDAWRRIGDKDVFCGKVIGERLEFEEKDLRAVLDSLPKLEANFDHVSAITLRNAHVSNSINDVLSSFKRLRALDLSGNALTRVPEAIANMTHLEALALQNNTIVLTQTSALQLRGLEKMRGLWLSGNPLGRPIDISKMPHLKALHLFNCGLDRWPTGFLNTPRPREFLMDLRSNPLTVIADVAPGSDKAGSLARTAVSVDQVSPAMLETLNQYRESVGYDAYRQLPRTGKVGSDFWMPDLPVEHKRFKTALWDSVEAEVGSEPFFDAIYQLTQGWNSRTPAFKADLQGKVWRMLEAIEASPDVRDKLFDMALAPTTCVDAGAQLFNAMGVEVLAYEAYASDNPELLSSRFFSLAKGRARLDELGRIARARVTELLEQGRVLPEFDDNGLAVVRLDAQGQPIPVIDEVEIYLAYTSKLAKQLDLPWQSEMFFAEPDVTQAMLDSAYERVLTLEEGDGLRDQLIEMPLWREFIEHTNRNVLGALREKNAALFDFHDAQENLLLHPNAPQAQTQAWRAEVDRAARTLGMPLADVVYGRAMTEEEYDAAFVGLDAEMKALYRTLTERVISSQQVLAIHEAAAPLS